VKLTIDFPDHIIEGVREYFKELKGEEYDEEELPYYIRALVADHLSVRRIRDRWIKRALDESSEELTDSFVR